MNSPTSPTQATAPLSQGAGQGATPTQAPGNPSPSSTGYRPSKKLLPSKWLKVGVLAGLVLFLSSGVAFAWYLFSNNAGHRPDLLTAKANRQKLQLTVMERGTLESANNHEVVCRVKAGSRGNTRIKSVVENGTQVNKDDVLVELDDSYLQDQLQTQEVARNQALANKISSEENYNIVKSQNQSDLQSARVALELAQIDLEKYLKGDYEQTKKDIEGRMIISRSDLEMWQDRVAWSERMVKKGFVTPSQSEAERARLQSAEISLRKVEEERRVLEVYTKQRNEKDLKNKFEEAERTLKRVEEQTESKEKLALAERNAKLANFELEDRRYQELKKEIVKCKIKADHAGLVVYYTSEQARFGSGSQQSIIAQGEPVTENQKLMTIPDLAHMVVTTRIHEALIKNVKVDQRAYVRVEAFPDKLLDARVKLVANIATPVDYYAPDVKVYQAQVAINETVTNLKPGMSAEVTILTDMVAESALCIPLQAIVPPLERGQKPKCFVLGANGPEERELELGLYNDKIVEVKDGLEEGEDVVLNPRALLGKDRLSKLDAAGGRSPGERGGPPKQGAGRPTGGAGAGAGSPGEGKRSRPEK